MFGGGTIACMESGDDPAQRSDCEEGEERCACYGNQTCNQGLTCYSGRCVDTQPDAGEQERLTDDDEPCDVGEERCPCYGNSTCNDGLACYSGFCVDPGSASGQSHDDGDDSAADDSAADDSAADDSADGSACYAACDEPADCALPVAYYDEDNFECDSGVCVYLGCHSDDECVDAGLSVCVDAHGSGVPNCARGCEVAADCSLGVVGFGEANHECVDGGCIYIGCASDADCSAANTVCSDSGTLRSCVPVCEAPADCVTEGSGYVEDNFACDDGVCTYVTCVSDDQCSAQLGGVPAVCR